ncbi:MAG: FHA domain-containing protein [Kofleriaceae bacterium]|jgi:hypothetical protein|nr:FHA domain-containing protein [Kofleriaceae bacterium]MBP6840737.1 FHA domain-containing protein [Kofleriaceae bacterium]MBP9204186.1 FHA domain-containing protein [Kofleriaceae bacterium]
MIVQLTLGTASARLDPTSNRLYAGRDPQACGLAFQDPGLSRRHAEVWLENGMTYLRDLGSSNGTWVDGQMVGATPVALRPGQQVYLGMIPLGLAWQGGASNGATMMATEIPDALKQLIEARQRQLAAPAPVAAAPAASAGIGVGGASAPLPADFAYRRQGANDNGVLLIALRQDTFWNGGMVEGFIEFTATDNENVASITVELVEFHKKGPSAGHVWDRVLVRQGPWRAQKGDVLPLPFQLRVPPGTSVTGRDVHWELHGLVDINWAVDIECTVPISMRNTDLERVRDALGSLDYRIVDLDSAPLGQRFEGKFQPPANLRAQLGIIDIDLVVEYLGANLKVQMHVDKKGMFKRDRDVEQVFDLARFRAAPLAEVAANFKKQIDDIMAM